MHPFNSKLQPFNEADYLRTLPSIRERCSEVFELAKDGQLQFFDYHPEKEGHVVDFCVSLIQRDYGSDYASIPPHGRWRHFDVGGHKRVDNLLRTWRADALGIDQEEICKRLLDLFLISVLLDAGAGDAWKYRETSSGEIYTRSEGLAIASLEMFSSGLFSGQGSPYLVDADGLERLTLEQFSNAMQVDLSTNPLAGLQGRYSLLSKLAEALRSHSDFFGGQARPGNLLNFLDSQRRNERDNPRSSLHVMFLWRVIMEGLASIWPATRTRLAGVSLGDVWPCGALQLALRRKQGPDVPAGEDLVPFHKLSQWLCYSLIEVLQSIMDWEIDGTEDMTGLPEYRNGGLLVDFGVLSLKSASLYDPHGGLPRFPASHPAIIEWRAMTVIELDRIANGVRSQLLGGSVRLSLAQILEGATWKGGERLPR